MIYNKGKDLTAMLIQGALQVRFYGSRIDDKKNQALQWGLRKNMQYMSIGNLEAHQRMEARKFLLNEAFDEKMLIGTQNVKNKIQETNR